MNYSFESRHRKQFKKFAFILFVPQFDSNEMEKNPMWISFLDANLKKKVYGVSVWLTASKPIYLEWIKILTTFIVNSRRLLVVWWAKALFCVGWHVRFSKDGKSCTMCFANISVANQ